MYDCYICTLINHQVELVYGYCTINNQFPNLSMAVMNTNQPSSCTGLWILRNQQSASEVKYDGYICTLINHQVALVYRCCATNNQLPKWSMTVIYVHLSPIRLHINIVVYGWCPANPKTISIIPADTKASPLLLWCGSLSLAPMWTSSSSADLSSCETKHLLGKKTHRCYDKSAKC